MGFHAVCCYIDSAYTTFTLHVVDCRSFLRCIFRHLSLTKFTIIPMSSTCIEYLCETLWLSVDPYMRIFSLDHPLGSTMIGGQVAK